LVFDGSDKAKRILGITSGSGGPDMNKVYAKYFEDSGIGVVAMVGMGIEFKSVPDVPPETIASFIKKAFAEHAGADAVYILGSSLEALRRSNASWACRSCKRLPRASGKSRSASMCMSR
jgi:maleate cis-trans isomerase